MMNTINREKIIKLFIIMTVVILPFSVRGNDVEVKPEYLTDYNVGFYQTNTCVFSFTEFAINNFDNKNIIIKSDFYSSINCFGKVNGVDVVNDNFYVYIGTNLVVNLVIQSIFWIVIISFIPKNKQQNKKSNIFKLLILSLFFTSQIFTESRFYNFYNKQFSDSFSIDNYFILSILSAYLLIIILCNDIVLNRSQAFINYFPFLFLIIGTFASGNNNFILLAISIYAINNINIKTLKNNYSKVYFILIILWIYNNIKVDSFFDVDKLRGFMNSSNSNSSLLYWAILFYLFIYGLNIITKNSSTEFNILTLKNSFLVSGSLVLFLGILGAKNTYFNFFNFYFFGQNKTGMNTFDSVAGNTWRGFSASAEAIGELYGAVIIFSLFIIWKERKISLLEILLLSVNFYGLYKANDIAVVIMLFFIFSYVVIFNFSKKDFLNTKFIFIFSVVALSVLVGIFIKLNPGTSRDYNFLSENLVTQSIKSSEYFTQSNPAIQNFLDESNYLDIQKIDQAENILSNSSILLLKLYNPEYNLPIFPNPASTLSILSVVINRTEKWGFFIAKYNPNFTQLIFGNGPLQFNNYYYGHNVANDDGLILPHSSLLDVMIFFGISGVLMLFYFIINIFRSFDKNIFELISIFLLINLLKSDSILYISSLILIFVVITLSSLLDKDSISYE